ncbi:MAG: T9SS C-terminal target domain-containing protein [Bacteroidetes bacterium]|nr:MAG: T9SS C-terminal target domain-containing protein [Bacteroidota bacterium]
MKFVSFFVSLFSHKASLTRIQSLIAAVFLLCFLWAGSTELQAQPGTLDLSFNAADDIGVGGGTNGTVSAQAILSDGKILIAGSFTTCNGVTRNRIARLNSDGSLDTSFDPGIGANALIYALAVQSDGKIVIGGGFTSYNGTTRNRIARLNADGSLDTGFSPGTAANTSVYTLAIQSDGKILIGGLFTTYGGISRNRIARINTNGTLDTGFTPGTGANDDVNSIAIQSDGKILIGGNFTTYNGSSISRIARLNANGSRDTGFNPGAGVNGIVYAFVVQADGKILIGGAFTTYNSVTRNRISRLNANGSLDTGFDPAGGANSLIRVFAVQSDGKVLIGGNLTTYAGTACSRIVRINTDGSMDAGFSTGAGINGAVTSLDVQADGKIIVGGGFTSYDGIVRNRIARANTDGTADAAFCHEAGANDIIYAIALQSDGKILIGGSFTTYGGTACNYITRLNADGSPDATFNSGGTGANTLVRYIAIQPDGKILIGGIFTSYNGTSRNYIARLNSNGSLDTGFNPGTGANSHVYSLAIQSDGKILIGGDFTSYNGTARNYIARLNTDGSLDTGFNPGTGANSYVNAVSVLSDGKILIGGNFTSYNGTTRFRIARINADGSLDTGFNPGTGSSGLVNALAVQPDGKILVTGVFTSYNGTSRNRIARVNADGSLDTGFDPGTGTNNQIRTLALQADNTILIGGTFTTYNGTARNFIARLNTDGSLYTGFDPGTGANSSIFFLALQSDVQVLIGGDFTVYNGTGRSRVARVNNDDASFPVSWLYVDALQQGTTTLLKWATATELQNKGFFVERSSDGRQWSDIGFVAGQGNSHTRQTYTFTDLRPLSGSSYYRLRQVDYDGRFAHSVVRTLYFAEEREGIRVYPNPLQGTSFTLQLPAEPAPAASWRLYTLSGQFLREGAVSDLYMSVEAGDLKPGIYQLRVQNGPQLWHERLVVQ